MGRLAKKDGVRGLWAAALCIVLTLSLAVPTTAWAYYDRGAVSVQTGVASVSVEAGETVMVSVTTDPASDEQTVGCGMAMCPQNCSDSCTNANGQCTCVGDETSTYYPTLKVSSSNASVATAVVESGTLTIYGRSAGTATITLTASLRQFTNGETTIEVTVTGEADASVPDDFGEADIPESATTDSAEEDVVKQTVMGRPIWSVRLTDTVDPMEYLEEMAGVDGEVSFYEGDTMFHPDYSVTFAGSDYSADDLDYVDPSIEISFEASDELTQPLANVGDFAVLDFAQQGEFPCEVTVYVYLGDVYEDGTSVALFSYDSSSKEFVSEDISVSVENGYAVFSTSIGKTYVLSTEALTSVDVVSGTSSSGDSCCTSDTSATGIIGNLPIVAIVAVIIVILAIAVLVAFILHRRRSAAKANAQKEDDALRNDESKGSEDA